MRRLAVSTAMAAALAAMTLGITGPAASASPTPTPNSPLGQSSTSTGKLDVLFVRAHPDDESGNLSTYDQ